MRSSRKSRAIRPDQATSARPEDISGKLAARDLHLEGAVIGTCLMSPEKCMEALEVLRPEHFWSGPNEWIFRAIFEVSTLGAQADAAAVCTWLREHDLYERSGGYEYIASLSNDFAVVHQMKAAATQLYDLWRVRRVIDICTRARAEGYTSDVGDKSAWIESVEASLYDVAHPNHKSDVEHVGVVLKATFERITAAAEAGNRIRGISTGYEGADKILAGLHDGTLMLLAARPGLGKTSFAMNLAVNVASPRTATIPGGAGDYVDVQAPGHAVAVFSLEMPREELGERMVCSEARVDMNRLRTGMVQPADWRALTEASEFLSTLPLWIDDTPSITLLEIRAKLRRIKAQWDRPATADQPERRLGLVVIDYLQLMTGSGTADSREQEVSEISRGLKQLAKDFKVPVLALSQLNRNIENRGGKDKTPQLSDLRESGSLEQDADVVMFVHRDEYFLKDQCPQELRGVAKLIIAKQRSGGTGKAWMKFTGHCVRFDNLAQHEWPEGDD